MERRGQVTVEYLLLLCSMLMLAMIVGTLFRERMDLLLESLAELLFRALFEIAA